MTLSVIIINWNRDQDLVETLNSIYQQNYDDFEVIVIDQNSEDNSVKLVKEKFTKVNLIELKENIGVAPGRNLGAKMAKGDVFIFLDNDIVIENDDSFKIVSKYFQEDPKIGALAFKVINYFDESISNWGYPKMMKKFSDKEFTATHFIGCGNAVRKSLFDKVGGFNEDYFFWGEEGEFGLKVYSLTDHYIKFTPKILIRHKISPISRFNWNNNRFYFKVRNRLDQVLSHYTPFPRRVMVFIYYLVGYFLISLKDGTYLQFFKGVNETNFRKLFEAKKTKMGMYPKVQKSLLFPIKFLFNN